MESHRARLIAAGLAVTTLLPKLDVDYGRRIIGVPLIALGAYLVWTSYRRWEDNERAMRLGQPLPPSNLPRVLAIGIAIAALLAAVIALFGSNMNDTAATTARRSRRRRTKCWRRHRGRPYRSGVEPQRARARRLGGGHPEGRRRHRRLPGADRHPHRARRGRIAWALAIVHSRFVSAPALEGRLLADQRKLRFVAWVTCAFAVSALVVACLPNV